MNKITSIRQLKAISKNDFVVLTELANPDHVNSGDRIHRSICRTLDMTKKKKTMPTSKHYYHVKKSQNNILRKYRKLRCPYCA